ncbi:hypothetical protein [Streptomyces sp. NPDC088554]|uniref:hypothetical protein n=1 Tax=Streptomyces sp. NPDC088554 TaxID=3365865 RepID=UPI003813AEB1
MMQTLDEMRKEKARRDAVAGCAGALAALPLEAWLLMLVLGAVHSVVAAVPAVGFGTALLFVIGLNMLTGRLRRAFGRK